MTPVKSLVMPLLEGTSKTTVRPRYEGNNICTWIGFKHVNYMVEDAILQHFRFAGLSSRRLFEDYALGLYIVSIDTRILNAFHLDDEATATITAKGLNDKGRLSFTVMMSREGKTVDVSSKVEVALRREDFVGGPHAANEELDALTVARIATAEPGDHVKPAAQPSLSLERGTHGNDPVLAYLTEGRNAFGWRWRIPYFYCHNNERLQMSGYLRNMEEIVDLFLANRGISIKTLLDDRRWIPVVPHSHIEFLDEALIEEDLYMVYTVEDIFKEFTYRSRMDAYVVRDNRLIQVATGTITHGYALIDSRTDWHLVPFDERVMNAFKDGAAAS